MDIALSPGESLHLFQDVYPFRVTLRFLSFKKSVKSLKVSWYSILSLNITLSYYTSSKIFDISTKMFLSSATNNIHIFNA